MPPKRGLTAFLIDVTAPSMTRTRLQQMNTTKTAAHYGIPVETVETYRKWQLGQQGGGA